MKNFFRFLTVLLISLELPAQNLLQHGAIGVQYAGSVGFLSAGYFKNNTKDKLSIGLVYGYTPKQLGGPLGSLSLKFRYNPFHLRLYKHLYWDPIQAGIFLAQNFGKNIDFKWGGKYPKGYYWWGSSFRQHVFFSTQLAMELQKGRFSKVSLYFETNTNDLYLYSYFPNRETLSLYDIFFFGIGMRLNLRD